MRIRTVRRSQDLEALLQSGYRFALALTHDAGRAEDLLQDAWVALLRRARPRRPEELLRSIRDRFLDYERRARLVALEPIDAASAGRELAFLDQPSAWPDPDSLEWALGELDPVEREAVYLAAVEDLEVHEIAELTGQLPGVVSSLLRRARRGLRKLLRPAREETTP